MTGTGTLRPVAGRLRYATQPEVGTIVGPTDITRELLVVIGHDDGWTLFGYAQTNEVQAARQRIADGEAPRSVTEARQIGVST